MITFPLPVCYALPIYVTVHSAAGSTLEKLKSWWQQLCQTGPNYGYFVNPHKSVLLTKKGLEDKAYSLFKDDEIRIESNGVRYLGGALGDATFLENFVQKQIQRLTEELDTLTEIAEAEPQAAHSAVIHGWLSKWNHLLRTSDWNTLSPDKLLQPLEEVLSTKFIPQLTGVNPPGQSTRDLLALPPRLGGLGLPNPTKIAGDQQVASKSITSPLVDRIMHQSHDLGTAVQQQHEEKQNVLKKKRDNQKRDAEEIHKNLSQTWKRCMEIATEKGASLWLTALPLTIYGFDLHKAAFRDAIALRYNLPIKNSPSNCVCGNTFSVEHMLSCSTGGFPSLRHNEVRDITADLLSEVCHGVSTEPHLQPIPSNYSNSFPRSANNQAEARLDVSMYGFWGGKLEKAFVDVRVFNPCAQSNCRSSLEATYRKHEAEKRRQYESRVREVERSSFTPLVMSATGGMGRCATVFYKRLAAMIAEKRNIAYNRIISMIRCRLSFALLRSSILCLRGARSSYHRVRNDPYEVIIEASKI